MNKLLTIIVRHLNRKKNYVSTSWVCFNNPAALKVCGWVGRWVGVGVVAYSNYLYTAHRGWIKNLINFENRNEFITKITYQFLTVLAINFWQSSQCVVIDYSMRRILKILTSHNICIYKQKVLDLMNKFDIRFTISETSL